MSGAHQKLMIPFKAGGAVPRAEGSGAIYVPGQEGGRLAAADMGLSGAQAAARMEAQGAENVARLGKALDNAVQTGLSAYEKYQQAKARMAFNQYQREELLLRSELEGLAGENALGEEGVRARFGKWRGEARERLAQDLAPMARELFFRQADDTDARSEAWTNGKEQRELRIFEDKVGEGAILNAREAVLAEPGNEEQMARAAGIIAAEYSRKAKRDGHGEDYAAARAAESARKLNMARIEGLIDSGDIDGAEKALRSKGSGLDLHLTEIARREAEKNGIVPELGRAIIMVESGGKQDVVSKAGAIGLMQLMPPTAKEEKVNPYDPEQNIQGGMRYFAKMLKMYKGDVEKALTAYNWGPANVNAYLKTGRGAKGQPMPKEAREYAGKVFGQMRGGMILPGDAGKLQKRIEGERRRRDLEYAQARAGELENVRLRYTDALAALQNGEEPMDIPDKEELRAAFGKGFGNAELELECARTFSADLRALSGLSMARQQELLKARKPEAGSGYKIRAEYYEKLARTVAADQKARAEDAVAYVLGADGELAKARQAFLEKPEKESFRAYRERLLPALADRGLKTDRLLSKSDAGFLGELFSKADDSLAFMGLLQEASGGDFDKVLNQVEPRLSQESRIALAAAGTSKESARALLEISKDKEFMQKARQLVPDWSKLGEKAIDEAVSEELEDFISTLPVGMYPELTSLATGSLEAVKKLAAWHALNGKMDLRKAIRLAAEETFNGHYYYNRLNGRNFRVPKTDWLDNKKIAAGVGEALKQVGERVEDFYVSGGADMGSGKAGNFAELIRGNGYVVTNEDESGVKVFVGGHVLRYGKGEKKGQPVVFGWTELMELGSNLDTDLENVETLELN